MPDYKSILVIEPSEPMRATLAAMLDGIGVGTVVCADNGQAGLDAAAAARFDAIICDLDMTPLNGWRVLQAMRQHPLHHNTPFLLMSSDSSRNTVSTALAAGVDDFLIKPFTAAAFTRRVQQLLRIVHHDAVRGQLLQSVLADRAGIGIEQSARARDGKAHLLVIDDDPGNLALICHILEHDYSLTVVTSGHKALDVVARPRLPELILLDVMMPDIDGFEVCRRLKGNPRTADIPVIFITALNQVADVVNGFDLGAVDYVTKPLEPAVLKARIRTHLALARARQALQKEVDTATENARLREHIELINRKDVHVPLDGIVNAIAAMLASGRQDISVREVEAIEESALQALDKLHRTSDIFLLESGSYRFKPEAVDLKEILRRAHVANRSLLIERGVSIRIKEYAKRCIVTGERSLCLAVASSLLRHAIATCAAGDEVMLAVESAEGSGLLRVYAKRKTAIALDDSIFDKPEGTAATRDTGADLYLSRLMMDIQHGALALSSPGDGETIVTMRLPEADR